ncbi:hypothetical protein KVT40_000646 [Elsinoe batatas]|uniref:Uncharacterized protein n=1 Tax=Elsinoe batatas TaxID=2601811 RepID=A0A8K0LBQ0_9PEZI|nr:hypothetical protein KVT40_000646 [Elsinoe batatas]
MVIPHSTICQQNMALLQSVDIADVGSAVMMVNDDRGGRSSTAASCPTEDGLRLRWEDPCRVNTWRSCGTLRTDFRANLCSVLGSIMVDMNASQLILGSKQYVVCPAAWRGLSCWGDVE